MSSCITIGVLFGTVLLIASIPDAASYSKYGRTCKDIGCRSDETCVMAEDPCTGYTNQCGRYPTCRRTSEAGCTSMLCGENEYCRSEDGAPRCVRKSTGLGYESAGVSYVNGERVSGERNNANPYANANAPPAPAVPAGSGNDGGYHRTSSGSNLGYPPYPQPGNQANHHQSSGYPPYPTQNRMPMPGQPSYSGYPPAGGYSQANYPQQQYPGYQNYPYQNYPNQQQRGYSSNSLYRRNAAMVGTVASAILVGFVALLHLAKTVVRFD